MAFGWFIYHLKDVSTKGPGKDLSARDLIDKIKKEIVGIEKAPEDPEGVMKWLDIIMLASDAAWRTGYSPEFICTALENKLNMKREKENPQEGK